MNSLVPLNYHGFPTVQYPSSYQTQSQYYPDQLGMQSTYLSPAGNHSYYGQHLNSINGYPVNELKRKEKGSYGEQFINLINKLDGQYRQERYSRQQDKLERRYWRDQINRLPPPMYPAGQTAGYYQTEGPAYHYEQEIRYVPFPVYITPNSSGGRGTRTTFPGEIAPVPFTGGFTTTNFLGGGNTMALPPKIRVIFIPTGSSPMQQPCMGPLTMPPFLFNRMAQPLCSFPLPPPLPQVGSLPLTPGIQEMVMQRYVNPIAVLPYTPPYQMPQAMAPFYPSMPQAAPALSYSGYQPVQSVAQSYMPALPAPQMPMMPALPPPPPPILAAPPMAQMVQPPLPQPQAFQPGYSAPMVQSFPQASQGYAHQQTPTGNYSTIGYSNPCRACPPAPPSLDIPVTGHCWVQHCSACHHVPMPIDHPNVRPSNGRVTPLLRHPTVPQYTPDQSMMNQTINPPELMRPWLRKTPPLPPGAVLISDEYLDARRDHKHRSHRSATRTNDEVRVPRQKERSATVTSATVTNSILGRNTQSKSPMTPRVTMDSRNKSKPLKPVEPFRVRAASSISSSTSSETSQELTHYAKVVLPQTEKKENSIPKELAAEARNVNLRYNYPAQELPSVYLNNRYIKSSSEGSSLSSNTARQSPSSSVSSKITMDETSSLKEKEKVKGLPPLPPKPPRPRIVVREYVTTSPSTISSNSSILSDIAFSIISSRKDSDSISTTSTIKATRLPDENKHKSKS